MKKTLMVILALVMALTLAVGSFSAVSAAKPDPPTPSISYGTITYDGGVTSGTVTVTGISWGTFKAQSVAVSLWDSQERGTTVWKPKGKAGNTWEPISSISVTANDAFSSSDQVIVKITISNRKVSYSETIVNYLTWGTPYSYTSP